MAEFSKQYVQRYGYNAVDLDWDFDIDQEFDKLSLFVRQPQAEPAAEMIHVSPMPMYSET